MSVHRVLAVLAVSLLGAVGARAADVDPASGLIKAENWELVRGNCVACHSLKLVTQQRGTAEHWLGLIRWMQATQNLWPFDPDTEKKIVDYLATNYPPRADQRRAAIPRPLMPPNPYTSEQAVSPQQKK